MCAKHQVEMEYLCLDCKEAFCRDCKVIDERHSGEGHTRANVRSFFEDQLKACATFKENLLKEKEDIMTKLNEELEYFKSHRQSRVRDFDSWVS
mmetsp:Transcript_24697/g.30826  ORF Transcript_24697/g.30826 Transcript_24697/m.30826 type:complete len:94 (-) Transcript_24697:860-1141(-)